MVTLQEPKMRVVDLLNGAKEFWMDTLPASNQSGTFRMPAFVRSYIITRTFQASVQLCRDLISTAAADTYRGNEDTSYCSHSKSAVH